MWERTLSHARIVIYLAISNGQGGTVSYFYIVVYKLSFY